MSCKTCSCSSGAAAVPGLVPNFSSSTKSAIWGRGSSTFIFMHYDMQLFKMLAGIVLTLEATNILSGQRQQQEKQQEHNPDRPRYCMSYPLQ